MSRKPHKSQASSSRAFANALGSQTAGIGIGSFGGSSILGALTSSPLSYVYEPPDLSAISEPNVIVAFKNLQKKDAATKSKALEELQSHVSTTEAKGVRVEEKIVEAWVKLYSRTSIDSARQVRRLAHLVQGHICVSFGKRIARYMPQMIGAWLAGLHDNDRSVARAALDSLRQVFNSEEKMKNVWRVYLPSIAQFAIDAVTKETPHTLSDERTTKPDDAAAKHARVVGTAISLVTNAIDELSADNHIKEESLMRVFLNEGRVWDFAADGDSFVRRSIYRLVVASAKNVKESLDLSLISATVLKKALSIHQIGSAFEYARALTTLTSETPEIWSCLDKLSTKKSPCQRLCEFFRKGSQAGPPEYWDEVANLIKQLPLDVVMTSTGDRSENDKAMCPVLEALHAGLASSDEPRANQLAAWNAYLDVASHVLLSFSSQNSRDDIAKHSLVPIVRQYIKPSSDEAQWSVGCLKNEDVCVKATHQVFSASPAILQETWTQLSHRIMEDIRRPTPDPSKDNSDTGELICASIIRWYSLQTAVFKCSESSHLKTLVSNAVVSELHEALQTLRESSGENYSAAIVLENAMKMPPQISRRDDNVMKDIANFAQHHVPRLLLSPSAPHLIDVLTLLSDVLEVNPICETGLLVLRNGPESAPKSLALQSFVRSSFLAQADEVGVLQNVVKENLELAIHGNESRWELVLAALGNPSAPKSLIDDLFARMTTSLSIEEERLASLHGLDLVLNRKGQTVKALVGFSAGSRLLSKLLLLAESPDDGLSGTARDISLAFESSISTEKDASYAVKLMVEIISEGLDTAGPESLSVDSLAQYAGRLLEQSTSSNRANLLRALLPSPSQWRTAMMPLMMQPPSLSYSHISPLGGALALIDSNTLPSFSFDSNVGDQNGLFPAFRMASYTVKLFRSTSLVDLTLPDRVLIVKNWTLLHQLATHGLSIPKPNTLKENVDVDPAIESDNLSTGIDYILKFSEENRSGADSSLLPTVQQQLLDDSRGTSPLSYYSACAFLLLECEYARNSTEEALHLGASWSQSLRKSPDIFRTLATLKIILDTEVPVQVLNETLADLMGYDFERQMNECLRQLVLLNYVLHTNLPGLVAKIPRQRLVPFVKHIVSQMHKGDLSKQITNEVLKALNALIPSIKDIYDSFWEQITDFIINTLSSPNQFRDNDNIPTLHATLELLATLKLLKIEESNDDLVEAWTAKEASLINRLLDILKECQGLPDDFYVPRRKVNCLLAQELKDFSHEISGEPTELYEVLACDSSALQLAAYHILHHQIPNAQGQISLDKALEKDFNAKLPDELLSLVITAPDPNIFDEADLTTAAPRALGSYLLSWKLIFDHWTNSSDKTKTDYAANLKEGSYLQDLLDFTFQVFIGKRSKPLNASAIQKCSFEPGKSKTMEEETHWLLVHLYYLSLRYLPSICRTWWRDTTSRQTAIAVENWTEKYISPLIITSELQAISAWAPSQSTAEQPMEIKVSPSTRETTASIPLDDQSLQISIRLPPSYPLARASVESLRRVAVDEKKWRGWLIATQGVINFTADGGQPVIEGLLAWSRNVTATLKGQTECAICYSVVGGDRQLPSKRCGTCKNCFHGSCLFKWFKSSNSSSCPLCRNAFNYA